MAGLRRKLRAQKRGSCLTLKRAKEGGMLENSFDVMIFTYFLPYHHVIQPRFK